MSFAYEARVAWSGSTGLGWDAYDRTHTAVAPPAEQQLSLTTGEEVGDHRVLNPEQLLVIAAASCQMLWFLHLAAKARIDVIEYVDEAIGEMPGDHLTRITLRPRIVVAGNTKDEQVLKLARHAHQLCNVAKSLRAEVLVEPTCER